MRSTTQQGISSKTFDGISCRGARGSFVLWAPVAKGYVACALSWCALSLVVGCATTPATVARLEEECNIRELQKLQYLRRYERQINDLAHEAKDRCIRKVLRERKIGNLVVGCSVMSLDPPGGIPSFAGGYPTLTPLSQNNKTVIRMRDSLQKADLWTDDPGGLTLTIDFQRYRFERWTGMDILLAGETLNPRVIYKLTIDGFVPISWPTDLLPEELVNEANKFLIGLGT